MVNEFIRYFEDLGEDPNSVMGKLLVSMAVFLVIYGVRFLLTKFLDAVIKDERKKLRATTMNRFLLVLVALYAMLYIWFSKTKSLGLIVAIALAFLFFALKDLITDMFAFIYISLRKPFSVGDMIEIKGTKGEVVDIDFIQFNMVEMGALIDCLSPTGRYVSFPNRLIFQEPFFNYNRRDPFVMQDVYVLIGFDSDRQEALKIAGKIAYEKYLNMIENYDEDALEHFKQSVTSMGGRDKPQIRAILDPNGFRIYIQFFTAYDEMGKNKMIMQNALYDGLAQAGFTLPSPTYIRLEE